MGNTKKWRRICIHWQMEKQSMENKVKSDRWGVNPGGWIYDATKIKNLLVRTWTGEKGNKYQWIVGVRYGGQTLLGYLWRGVTLGDLKDWRGCDWRVYAIAAQIMTGPVNWRQKCHFGAGKKVFTAFWQWYPNVHVFESLEWWQHETHALRNPLHLIIAKLNFTLSFRRTIPFERNTIKNSNFTCQTGASFPSSKEK